MARVEQEVLHGGVELIQHIGDISYANGDPDIWDTFLEAIEPFASRAAYMIGIGNVRTLVFASKCCYLSIILFDL